MSLCKMARLEKGRGEHSVAQAATICKSSKSSEFHVTDDVWLKAPRVCYFGAIFVSLGGFVTTAWCAARELGKPPRETRAGGMQAMNPQTMPHRDGGAPGPSRVRSAEREARPANLSLGRPARGTAPRRLRSSRSGAIEVCIVLGSLSQK